MTSREDVPMGASPDGRELPDFATDKTLPTPASSSSTRRSPPLGRAQLMSLSQRRDAPGVWRALTHFLAILLVAIGISVAGWSSWYLAVPLFLIQAYLIAFLFTVVHECAHKTAFRSRWLNLAVGHAASIATALPYEYYCQFHWDHHRYTQDPERDPELLFAKVVPDTVPQLALWFSGVMQLALRIRLVARHALTGRVSAPWVAPEKRSLIVREARFYMAIYLATIVVGLVLHSTAFIWAWWAPLFIGQIVLRPYLLAEHTGCDHSRSAMENTRTTTTNGLVRWFAWNMPYHAEHHSYPSVPFHSLPALNAVMAPEIRHQGRSYRRVARFCWRWFRAKSALRSAA